MILSWSQLKKEKDEATLSELERQVYDICLLSAEKSDFKSEEEKNAFCWRWVGQYLDKFSDLSFLLFEGDLLLGYIVGCPDTSQFLDNLDQKGLFWWCDAFPEGYKNYPAHLHINCHPKARGKGAGSQLMDSFLKKCLTMGLSGVHLITVKGARNVSFYEKQGFQELAHYEVGHDEPSTLVFLGKMLSNS